MSPVVLAGCGRSAAGCGILASPSTDEERCVLPLVRV